MKKWTLALSLVVAIGLYLILQAHKAADENPRHRLSPIINSEYQEVRPFISPDGNFLYFSRRYHPENTGGKKDFQDVWMSEKTDDTWSVPVRLDGGVNNKKANSLCSITADGSYAILLDSYKKVKTPVAQIYRSETGWGVPGDLVIKDFTNQSAYYDFYYHEPSANLLMAIDNGGGQGQQDLHVSFKQPDGSYSRPKNLGREINSVKADFAPFLAADGRTLFFASYGHHGMGGSDLFVSYRMDDSWQKWTEPQNLGAGINSEDDENYISVTGDLSWVYFESYPTGSEHKDIFRARLPERLHPKFLTPLPVSGQPIAEYRTSNVEHRIPNTQEMPNVERRMPNAQETSNVERRMPNTQQPSTERLVTSLAITRFLENGKVKSKVLNHSYFGYDSYQLSQEYLVRLNEITRIMMDNPDMEAQLTGHSDSWGSSEANMRVSYLRAQAAAHYLIDQGIAGSRLLVLANGDRTPMASNDDEQEGRELNRRVEITLSNPAGAQLVYLLR